MADTTKKSASSKASSDEPATGEAKAEAKAQETALQSVTGDPDAPKPVWNRETQGDPPPGREDQYDVIDGTETADVATETALAEG